MAAAAIPIVTGNSFRLADRIRIQQERIREKDYISMGRLLSVLFEAQRNTIGLSQSRARYANARQAGIVPESLKPFSEKQALLFQSTSLDWLTWKKAPVIARSKDRRDLLLPAGLTPLPDIPDPRWSPSHALSACPKGLSGCRHCVAPRIPQLLTGCPVVGDRVRDKITARNGQVFGILHPILQLSVMVSGSDGEGHFANIRGGVDQSDGTHLALLIDDDNNAFFVGGTFS